MGAMDQKPPLVISQYDDDWMYAEAYQQPSLVAQNHERVAVGIDITDGGAVSEDNK